MDIDGLWHSFRAAGAGVVTAWRKGRNMRFHALAGYTVLVLGYWIGLPRAEYALLMFVVALVAGAELINTAVETAVDLKIDGYHPLAKEAKDIAAGAVLLSAVAAAGAGAILFYPRLPEVADVLWLRFSRPGPGTLAAAAGFVLLLAGWLASFRTGGGSGRRGPRGL